MELKVSPRTNDAAAGDRRALADAVLDEITSWNPREFLGALRRWHDGALSLVHLNVLTILESDGATSMSHLADALDVSVASMTGIVDRMERRGLVERHHDEGDRRVVLVRRTDAGVRLFREIDAMRRVGLGKVLHRLTDEQLAGLLEGHRALRRARADLLESAITRVAEPTPTDSDAAPKVPASIVEGGAP